MCIEYYQKFIAIIYTDCLLQFSSVLYMYIIIIIVATMRTLFQIFINWHTFMNKKKHIYVCHFIRNFSFLHRIKVCSALQTFPPPNLKLAKTYRRKSWQINNFSHVIKIVSHKKNFNIFSIQVPSCTNCMMNDI